MEISKEHRQNIEAIRNTIECAKDVGCCTSEFENLIQAKELVHDQVWQCLAPNPQSCNFAMSFGECFLCQCPLRQYIAKELNI